MAEETETTEEQTTDTDIFQTLKKTNELLVDVLAKQKTQEPLYIQSAQPEPQSPNYLLYIGIGVLALILIRKVKL